jgi:drug/metabolite transporter (DMT)-like permease
MNGNSPPSHPVAAGIAYMCSGVAFLVALDVAARWLMQTYALTQLIFLRSVISMSVLLLYAAGTNQIAALRTHLPGWHLLRSLLMAGSMLTFFHALRFIPLADIMVFVFSAPLIVTALSRPVLGERVGRLRWAAVVAGFIGVLVVFRPGTGAVHPAAIYAVAGAAFYACLGLTARKLGGTESTLSLSLYVFAAPLLMTGVACIPVWQTPGAVDWLLFFLCGAFGALGIVFISAAYRRTAAAVVAPFEYTALIWGASAGYVIWDEVPDAYAWVGAAFITASGLFIVYRETLARSRRDALECVGAGGVAAGRH